MVSFYCPLKQEPQVPSDANCNFSSIFGVFLTPWTSESFRVDLLRILCRSLVFHLCCFVTHCFLKTATVNATLNIFKLPPPRFFKGKAICKMCLLNLWLRLSVTASLLNHPQAVLCSPLLFRSAPAGLLPSSYLHSASVVKGRAHCGLTYPAVTPLIFPPSTSRLWWKQHLRLFRAWAVVSVSLCCPRSHISPSRFGI